MRWTDVLDAVVKIAVGVTSLFAAIKATRAHNEVKSPNGLTTAAKVQEIGNEVRAVAKDVIDVAVLLGDHQRDHQPTSAGNLQLPPPNPTTAPTPSSAGTSVPPPAGEGPR